MVVWGMHQRGQEGRQEEPVKRLLSFRQAMMWCWTREGNSNREDRTDYGQWSVYLIWLSKCDTILIFLLSLTGHSFSVFSAGSSSSPEFYNSGLIQGSILESLLYLHSLCFKYQIHARDCHMYGSCPDYSHCTPDSYTHSLDIST